MAAAGLGGPCTNHGAGLFLTDRPLGFLGATVTLARRLGLIDALLERALSGLRMLRNTYAHCAELAPLAALVHRSRLTEIYAEALTNPRWAPLETVQAAQQLLPMQPPVVMGFSGVNRNNGTTQGL